MSAEFILEIGTEEIPSGYLEKGLKDFKNMAEIALKENHIGISGGLSTFGTPRRLVLVGQGVAVKQEDVVQEITGPPKKAAFDAEGNPTKAAVGFAKKQGVSMEDLQILETPKGAYLHVKRQIPGKPTRDVLSEVFPRLIGDLPWPKSMRWGQTGYVFVRPIHWVLALFDGEVIPFEIADIKSGNRTQGHRFMSPGALEVKDFEDYLDKLDRGSVIVDPNQREDAVEKAVLSMAETLSGRVVRDPELLATVANLVEFPFAVGGSFDEKFLDLPDPVLITAMREHQKYFSLYDRDGRLMPNFVAVNNTRARDESVVRKGHERVLRARLADAAFFFEEDRKRPLQSRLEDLKTVIYQAELGSSYEKMVRFRSLAEFLTEKVAPEKKPQVGLAAELSKCDLVTEMVMEFPSLQGVMGKEYARLDGHPEEVCQAILEHYLPVRAGGDLPQSLVGAIVGVADRLDTITGCFAVQQEPTGAADPFALRRHALAIIRIVEHFGWSVSLHALLETSIAQLQKGLQFDGRNIFARVLDFFRDRFKQLMLRSGYESDLIEAVISADFEHIERLRMKIDHLKSFMVESEDFEALVLTSKRVNNILKNQAEEFSVDPGLFNESCEHNLWQAFQGLRSTVFQTVEQKNYVEALRLMGTLRKPVDELFDGVEILTKEKPKVKENRIGMLQSISRLFMALADFSRFSI